MRRLLCAAYLVTALAASQCLADRATIAGTANDARSGIPVTIHPVLVTQGSNVLARDLTDRLGKFSLEFAYQPQQPLTIKAGSTTAYLEAQGIVEPDTEVLIKIMPRWATILGIVTDHGTGRGLAGIPVSAGRGAKPSTEEWASTTTDATGVYMLRVLAFDGDDVTKAVRDLWLSINEGDDASLAHAAIRTDSLPLWAWPDRTQPAKVEVSLPAADAEGLTIADVVAIKMPEALRPAATPPAPEEPAPTATATAHQVAGLDGECIIVCPHCG